jgi:GNAT superfamily N-acetyltransferase
MNYTIRRATLEDGAFLVNCLQAMLADMESYGGLPLAEAGRLAAWLSEHTGRGLLQEDHLFLAAAPEEAPLQPAGMVEASLVYPEEVFWPARTLHIAAVYVHPDHRHAGLGRRLLEAAIAWGREQGCVQVELNVLAGNPAHRLYEKMGFGVYEMQLRLKL